MEQPAIRDALPDTVEVSDEVRERVTSIVRLLDDLDAAMRSLEPEAEAFQLSRQVRAELIRDLFDDATEYLTDRDQAVGCHPTGPLLPPQ